VKTPEIANAWETRPAAASSTSDPDLPAIGRARVAVICDFLEEHWPSMDLAGDMLCRYLAENGGAGFVPAQMRPSLHRRFSRLPFLPRRLARNADLLINRFGDYPLWLRGKRRDYDLFHLVDHSYGQLIHGLPPRRTVVTCHDLDTFRCLLEPEREMRPGWFRAMTRRILGGFRQAAHVIAVSEATRSDLLRHGLFPPERISVVHNGVHPSCSALPDLKADAEAARLLPGDRPGAVSLLNVGSTLPRKRLDWLLRVFAAVRQQIPEARLVRVGGGFTKMQLQLASKLGVERSIVILPFLDRNILAAVYRRAAVLLHTAEAEGFGLPILESMACGCPVVASDVAVLREVGAAAATYCRLDNLDDWKATVTGLVRERTQDPRAWELRRQRGVAQSARFTWAENARQTAAVYRKILEND